MWNADKELEGSRRFESSFVIRLDGKGFSSLTKKPLFCKPYDEKIATGMNAAVDRVLDIMLPDFVYTVSDEISAFFIKRSYPQFQFPYGGREGKLCSIAASCAGVGFSMQLQMPADFDARAFECGDDEMPYYLASRTKSGFKNSVNQLAQEHFSPKSLHGVDSFKKIEMLIQKDIYFESMPNPFKYGTIWYKQKTNVWSDTAGAFIVRQRWTKQDLEAPFDKSAFGVLKDTILNLTGKLPAGPKPGGADPVEGRHEQVGPDHSGNGT